MTFRHALIMIGLAATACGPIQSTSAPPSPERAKAIAAAAETTASILDAIHAAPPAGLVNVTIADAPLRKAWQTFDTALTIIEFGVDSGMLKRNSPEALLLRRGVLATQAALNAASAAQRAGAATSYRQALDEASAAYANVQLALTQAK